MKRTFQIVSVTKPGQKNASTKFDKTKLFSGEPRNAAMKAMTHLCSRKTKQIRGVCTLTVVVAEVKVRMVNGVNGVYPVLDSSGYPKMYKYKLKREMYHDDESSDGRLHVEFNGDNTIPFKYKSTVVESYGRVVPT